MVCENTSVRPSPSNRDSSVRLATIAAPRGMLVSDRRAGSTAVDALRPASALARAPGSGRSSTLGAIVTTGSSAELAHVGHRQHGLTGLVGGGQVDPGGQPPVVIAGRVIQDLAHL